MQGKGSARAPLPGLIPRTHGPRPHPRAPIQPLGSHGAMCSGGTARPRAVWEPEGLIPAQVLKDSLGVEQRC